MNIVPNSFNVRKALGRIGIIAAEVVIVGILFVTLAFILFGDTVQNYPSFWLGATGLFAVLVLLVALYAASHPATKIWPGTLIGLVVVIAIIVAMSLWKPFENFAAGDFFWGLLTLVIVIAIAIAMRLAAWLCYRVPKPKPAPVTATAPAAQPVAPVTT